MTTPPLLRALLGVLIACTLVAVAGAPASAKVVERESFQDDFSFVDDDFCGAGIAVQVEGVADVRYQVNTRGRNGEAYYLEHVRVRTVLTKDLSVIDNGDGTLTIVYFGTGGARVYGDDGRLIASNSGQVRFRIVVDAETFEELSRELILGSTGTNDDFCEAVLTDWGYL
jgi:hypothetical protein